MSTNRIIIGALLGSAIAAASYSLLATKSGKKMRKNFLNNCEDFGETLEDFVSSFKDTVTNGVSDQANDAWKKIACVKKELKSVCDYENKETQQGLLIGALLGVVTGTLGTLAFQGGFCENSGENRLLAHAIKWKNILSTIVDTAEQKCDKVSKMGSKDLLSLAVTGINLWQNRKK